MRQLYTMCTWIVNNGKYSPEKEEYSIPTCVFIIIITKCMLIFSLVEEGHNFYSIENIRTAPYYFGYNYNIKIITRELN